MLQLYRKVKLSFKVLHLVLILSVLLSLFNVVEGPSHFLLEGVRRPEVWTNLWIGSTFDDGNKGVWAKLLFWMVFNGVLVSRVRKGRKVVVRKVKH